MNLQVQTTPSMDVTQPLMKRRVQSISLYTHTHKSEDSSLRKTKIPRAYKWK